MTEDSASSPQPSTAPPQPAGPPPQNTFAGVALGIGVGAVAAAVIPFYGLVFALPLGAGALTFGILGIRQATQLGGTGRGLAIAGTVTGSLALVGTVAWAATLFTGFLGGNSATSAFSAGVEQETAVPAPAVEPEPPPEVGAGAEIEAHPPAEGPSPLHGDRGRVELTVEERETTFTLEECTVDDRGPDTHARGDGPDGAVSFTSTADQLLLVVAPADGEVQVLRARSHGYHHSARGGRGDEREVRANGEFADALTAEVLGVSFMLECR